MALAFDPTSRRIVSAGNGEPIKVWDIASGQAVLTVKDPSRKAVRADFVAVSPNGRVIAYDDFEGTKLIDYQTGSFSQRYDTNGPRGPFVFSADGTRLVAQTADAGIAVLELATGHILQKIEGHSRSVNAFASHGETAKRITGLAISRDGKLIASASEDRSIKIWSARTGQLLRSIQASVSWIAFTPDSLQIVSSKAIWDLQTGQLVKRFFEDGSIGALSIDGRWLVASDTHGTVKTFDVATGAVMRTIQSSQLPVMVEWPIAVSHEGRWLLSGGVDKAMRIWDLEAGALVRSFKGHKTSLFSVAFSPDGRYGASGDFPNLYFGGKSLDSVVNVWELQTGRLIHTLTHLKGESRSVSFSPDGKLLLSSGSSGMVWDVATGRLLYQFPTMVAAHARFSPDGKFLVSTGEGIGHGFVVWDAKTGTKVRQLGNTVPFYTPLRFAFAADSRYLYAADNNKIALWDLQTGSLVGLFGTHDDETLTGVTAMAISSSGNRLVTGAGNGTIRVWPLNAAVANPLTIRAHSQSVRAVAVTANGTRILSASPDGTIRVWDGQNGSLVATLVANAEDDWITIIREGFFQGTLKAMESLSVARGLEVTTIQQVHQSLYNPDLVREALAGDPTGQISTAANVANLGKVLDSGPAPLVSIDAPANAHQSVVDIVEVIGSVEDRGKGVGRVEWRVNGITAAVATEHRGGGPIYTVKQQLALDPGSNTVELVAYNGSNLLASLPARTTIKLTAAANTIKPKLHILAIGIDAYVDKGWSAPGANTVTHFPPLGLAVKDARAFGDAMKKAGAGLYDEVHVTLALDQEATNDNLHKIVDKVAASINARDSFILFAAAHGKSENGRFYLIPQDYQSGPPGSLAQRAIGQESFQKWLANRIKARRALILLDTCESGALVGGYAFSRTDSAASEAAVGRLHEATGRPVLTAAAAGQFAHEGLIGATGERHGVFTWAVLDALRKGDSNGNGTIELSELVRHVQRVVPKAAEGTVRAATSDFELGTQTARFGSRGEDFIFARRLH